jgi:hypothetical protein
MGEKMTGYKEELIGKVKRDEGLVQHGRDIRTGELQRREREEAVCCCLISTTTSTVC